MEKDRNSSCVYRYIDKNDIVVYVGRTADLIVRHRMHTGAADQNSTELAYCRLEFIGGNLSVSDADILETYFISKYKPRLNKEKITWNAPTLINVDAIPEWTPYGGVFNRLDLVENLRKRGLLRCDNCGRFLPTKPTKLIAGYQGARWIAKYVKEDLLSLCDHCAMQEVGSYLYGKLT